MGASFSFSKNRSYKTDQYTRKIKKEEICKKIREETFFCGSLESYETLSIFLFCGLCNNNLRKCYCFNRPRLSYKEDIRSRLSYKEDIGSRLSYKEDRKCDNEPQYINMH